MLDIAIFYTDTPVYDNGKKIGSIPKISLGDYTPLTSTEQKVLSSASKNLPTTSLSLFENTLHQIGKRFFIAQLLLTYNMARSSRLKNELYDRIQLLYPNVVPSIENIQKEKKQLKSFLNHLFIPEQQVQMMIQLKEKHDHSKNSYNDYFIENEIFARGIAECVQSLRDIPQDKKSPLIRRLCIRSTHRGQLLNDHSRE